MNDVSRKSGFLSGLLLTLSTLFASTAALATPFTMTVPGTGLAVPTQYPEAGGAVIIMTGVNGNVYYQFSDPDGAFVGFQNSGQPAAFRGNPFTINDPIALDCGFRTCSDYFGGEIAQLDVRFSAYDGDTQVGGFDYQDINLIMNGYDVGSWSDLDTQVTNLSGTSSIGANNGIVNGFGNRTFNTAWFSSNNPDLLGNILATGRTTTQVQDDDPSDNYWDFTYGNSLGDEALRTIAPGYELEKSRDIADLTYATVDQVINYQYIVRNIGSVNINDLEVEDDKITAPNTVVCDVTTLPETETGGTAAEATCTASYVVTQADIDAGTLTNVAIATGTPEYGSLGALQDTVTLTGPTFINGLRLEKTADRATFSAVDEVITYTFEVFNEGNATLTNVVVTDPMIPTLSCTTATLLPLSDDNTVNSATCTGTYTVTQEDIDAADAGTAIVNTAKANARDPKNAAVTAPDAIETVTGPDGTIDMTLVKTATTPTYAAVGDEVKFDILITNTGNVTWPVAPTVTDVLTSGATCPTGPVAPDASITCTATYVVDQDDLDLELVTNEASAEITVNGDTATDDDTAVATAVVTPSMTITKALQAGSPDPFTATTDRLVYVYTVKNTGNVSVKDLVLNDDKVGLTCLVTDIAPDDEVICTSDEYAITQPDLDAGFVTNTVTADANTAAGDPVDQVETQLTVDADQTPAMTVVKTAEAIVSIDFQPGIPVDYEYLVTNTGNVTLTDLIQIRDDKFPDPIDCPTGDVPPMGTVLCEATYTVTDDDVRAGFVTNKAYADDGTTTSDPDEETIPQDGTPAISLVKEAAAGSTYSATTDSIAYTFTVTNTGDVTLAYVADLDTRDEIVINDPQISSVTCVQPPFLFPVGSGSLPTEMTCTGTFSGLDQGDIDAGEFTNTATASFTYVNAGVETAVTSPEASETVPADITPGFTFTKSAPVPATFSTLNETVTFTFEVTNTSPQTITQIVVTDVDIPTLDCTLTNIGPAGSGTDTASCTGDYSITQTDMDAGTFTNEAIATGTTPTGAEIGPQSDDATVTLPAGDRNESLAFDKIASTDAYAAVDDEITYQLAVTNDGNVTLENITVIDVPLGVNCVIPTLAVGVTDNSTCVATKVITQDDIDQGSFENDASASTAGGAFGEDDELAAGPPRAPEFSFMKSTADTYAAVNDTINFTFAVKNEGNVTLTNVIVTDDFFTPAFSCTIATLAPGVTDNTTCSASYDVDQNDLDVGEITNTATTNADSLEGALPSQDSTVVVTAAPEQATVTIDKVEADGDGLFGGEGSAEAYTFTITNTGLVTLFDVEFTDPLMGLTCDVADLVPGAVATECEDGTLFADSYTILQSNVDAGSLTNVAAVTATTVQGTELSEDDQVILAGPDQLPLISLIKSSTAGTDFDAVGDQIDYRYEVTNDGNITLTAPITIADSRVTVVCPDLPVGGLAPMATLVCLASDTVDQADLDAGEVVNDATASVSQPVVASTAHPMGTADVSSAEETVIVPADQEPALSILKRVKAGTPSTYDATTDVVTYEFVVTNEGNVTTTGQITVSDLLIPASVVCGPANGIAPGDTVTCETTWSPDQNDIDVGEFTNEATASMPFDGDTIVTPDPSEVTVYAVQQPAMTLTKTYRDGSLADFADEEVATYDFLITNTGNQTIIGPITVQDNLIANVDCSAATGDLAPGGTTTCEGDYELDVTDIQLGSVTNVAFATSVTVDSETTSEQIPEDGDPAMSITKVADLSTFTKAGDFITYTYTVTNTSTGSPEPAFANPIRIQDDKFPGGLACWETSGADPDVRAGETVTCEPAAIYEVTQADMDALRADPDGAAGDLLSAFVKNTANGQTTFGTVDVVSQPVSVLVQGDATPSLLVEKVATSVDSPAVVGSIVNYEITVTNDGNQTISGIIVTDPMLDSMSCSFEGAAAPANLILEPLDVAICTGSYEVTQDDVDAQVLENTATATGSDPTGDPLVKTGTTTYPLDPFGAAVEIVKTLDVGEPDTAYTDPGQLLTYNIAVKNTGNVTLTSTDVTDVLFPGQVCEIATLAPMQEDTTTCQFIYEVTQEDIDRGEIVNVATATSQPATPDSDPVTDDSTITGTGPERVAEVSIGKKADVTEFDGPNQPIVYTYTVINSGNVTLEEAPTVTDDKIVAPNTVTCDAFPAGGLEPTETLECEATYLTTQDDVDNGDVTNIATVSAPNPLDPATPLINTADLTVDAVQEPAMTMVKTAEMVDLLDFTVGGKIDYEYLVTNTGNVTLKDAITIVDDKFTDPIACPAGDVAPDDTVLCEAEYTITEADVLAGFVTNIAYSKTGDTESDTDTETVQQTGTPALTLDKSAAAGSTFDDTSDTIDYTFTVTNSGNVTLGYIADADTRDEIVITDPQIADVTCVQPAFLYPAATGISPSTMTCTGTFDAIDQTILDAGEFTNTATASFTYVDATGTETTITSPEASETVAADITPSFTFTKSAPTPATFSALNEAVTFTFEVTNTSTQTIAEIVVTDADIPALDCTLTNIGPAGSATETATCTGVYNIDQIDMDAGTFTNEAAASGTSSTGDPIVELTDDATVTLPAADRNESLTFDKIASTDTFAQVDDEITYKLAVTNNGNVTLKDITVVDPILEVNCLIPSLDVGDSDDTTCLATKVITQDDIDNGSFVNDASASTAGGAEDDDTETATGPTRAPDFTFLKSTTDSFAAVDDEVEFTFEVKNTGNVTLTDVIVTDGFFTPAFECIIATLAPDATDNTTCSATYEVEQADLDAGTITNTATANANSLEGALPSQDSTVVVTAQPEVASVTIEKVETDGNGLFGAVDTLEAYGFTITNTGLVTLIDVEFSDPLTGLTCPVDDIGAGQSATACADGTAFADTYQITQDDIDLGTLTNVATVTASTTQGTALSEDDTVVLNGPVQAPALTMVKTSTAGTGFDTIGDQISYRYVVTNAGNITLTEPITVADDRVTVTCDPLPLAGLAPMGELVCTATDTVDQDDLDAGEVVNNATASVSQSVIPSPLHPDGTADVSSPEETVNVPADQDPALSILKRVKAGTPSTYDATTDVVTYEFVVTNEGNVTTTDQITVSDLLIPASVDCGPAGGIAPGDTVTCETTWSPEQNDIDVGEFANEATASMPFDGDTIVTPDPSEVTVYAVQQPAMEVTKTYRDGSLADYADGETAIYDFLIKNTGNQTIVGPIQIDDNLIDSVDCSSFTGDLAPLAEMTCEGSYELGVVDIQLGSATNVAFATSPTVNSETTSEIIPENGVPAMTITKVADVSTFTKAGDFITYTYTVSNTSTGSPSPAFANEIRIQDDKFPGGLACWETSGADPDVRAGETVTCTPAAVYEVTQADMDALRADPNGNAGDLLSAFVKNTANGQTTFSGIDVVSQPVSVLVQGAPDPSLLIEKLASSVDNPAVAGSIVDYLITVTNDGNQTISGIVIDDPMLDNLSCTVDGNLAPANLILAPLDVAICEGTYEVLQSDVDAQVLENEATATGSDPTGEPVTKSVVETYPIDPLDADVQIVKTLAAGTPALAYTTEGQQIVYNIAVTNTGNVTLTTTEVTDVLFPGQVCDIGSLAPDAVDDTTCKFTYRVTQDDIDNGEIINTASASSQPATPGSDLETDDSTITAMGPTRAPSVTITKTADVSDYNGPNQPIVYTYTVINNGNVTLTSAPTVTDDKIVAPNAVSCDAFPAGGLAPTETLACEATYMTSLADVNAGSVTNVVTVVIDNPLGGTLTDNVDLTIDAVRSPELSVTKQASDTTLAAKGQTITYTYVVTNTGNVTQTDVTLSDAHTTQAGTANLTIANSNVGTLLPGETATRTATYLVTQADIDAGTALTNTVTATGISPVGVDAPTPATADQSVTVATADPAIVAVKTADALPAVVTEGTVVTFTVTVTNTGNVSLDDITLQDTLTRRDGTLITPAPTAVFDRTDDGIIGTLDVDENWVYSVEYALTQADIDAGGVSNSVRALGTDPFDTTVSDVSNNNTDAGSDPAVVTIAPAPAITTTKRITANPTTLNGTVRFEIDVQNTGNVSLTNVGVTDTLTRADSTALTPTTGPTFFSADAGSSAGTLLVGETATYRVTYVLTQEDVDAGGIENTAMGTGTPPIGTAVTDDVDAPVVLPIAADPSIEMVKSLTSGGPTFDAVDDVLGYTFTIKNTGNVTLTDAFTITDPLITNAGGAITCEAPPLAPDDSLTCEGSYSVAQGGIDLGRVDNAATASNGVATSDPSTTSTPAQQNPAMVTVKKAESITVDGATHTDILSEYFKTNAVVAYSFTVTNTGNVTLTDAIEVSDNRIANVVCPALPTGGLLPDDSLVCEADYTITGTDVRLTSVTNAATATSGDTTAPIVTETIPADGIPLLTIEKTLTSVTNPNGTTDPNGTFDEVGDVLNYSFLVTNAGTIAFADDVTVEDALLDAPLVCFTPTGADPDLAATEFVTCEDSYTVDQDDLDAAQVFNEAIAQTLFEAEETPVISQPDTVTTPAAADPKLTIAKSVTTLPITAVDQVLTYTLTLTNAGNQTLTNVKAVDPLLPALSCEFATLASKAVETCSGTYTVLQSDLDAGTLVNTASVTGIAPNGDDVGDTTSLTTAVPDADPVLLMTKVGSPDPFGAVGSGVTYVFTLTNMGNVTLFDLNITDDIADPTYSCRVARLGVGETDDSCTLSYKVTQDDKDAGEILNVATVTGRDPFGPITPVEARSDLDSVAADPSLEVTKTASLGGSVTGATVTFDLLVENTGDVSLVVGTITDTMTRNGGTPISLTTPFAYVSGDADNDGELDVTETWLYQGTRVLTLDDVNALGFKNSARVFADDPFGTQVADISDDGDDFDGNTANDPTVVDIVPGPAIETVKTLLTAGAVAGDKVVFQITATNVGNVTLTDVTPSDAMTRADGTPIDPSLVTIVQTSGSSFDPVDVLSWSVTYELTQADVDAGGLSNVATVTGTSPSDLPIVDVSDNGDDTDGNTDGDVGSDPTVMLIESLPAFEVVKTVEPFADDTTVAAGDVVTFHIAVANNGNVTLADLVLTDTLTRADGVALAPDGITLTQGASDTQIDVGETLIFTVLYSLVQADLDAGGIQNIAVADVVTPAGDALSDTSDNGDDTDGNTTDDPTIVPITQISALIASKEATIPVRIAPDLSEVVFTIKVENTGNVSQSNLIINDNLIPFVTPATLSGKPTVVVSGFDGTGGANPSYNGESALNLVTGDVHLLPGSVGTILLTVTYDTSGGNYPSGTNTVEVISDRLVAGVFATVNVVQQADPDIVAIKTATPDDVILGDTVTYTLTFENRLNTFETNLTVIDTMPNGVIYTPGTARFDGSATPAPVVTGREMRWSGVSLSPRQLITITFDARVVGDAREMTNRASMVDLSGEPVSNIAAATITRRPEAVFECTDIIGTVFDDRNMNGYQDGAVAPDNSAVTDQTFAGGKGKLAPAPRVDTGSPFEPGLPNVRVVTVDGTVITTDEYGRFSVPCADLPASIGSNFTLKLDPRSLPTGYRVTTENPRVVRVTPGTVAKLNFGAAISTVVDIDLMASAFQAGTNRPTAALVAGIDQLVRQLRDTPSVLRLSYYMNGEGRSAARTRLDAVETLVRDAWRDSGRYRLLIERTIRQMQ